MKGKKLLAGLLSAAMVLGTMVMPAFAENVSSDDEFKEAVEQNERDIVLTANVSYDRQGQRSTIADGSTIDLNGKQLTLTGYGYEFKNTTIKNGKIIISGNNQRNGIFSDYNGYTLTFDNVELTADNLRGPYLMSSNFGNGTFILTNGTMFNVTGVSEPNKFYAMQSMGSLEVLNGSKITFTGPERGIVNANVKVDATSELDFTTGLEGLYLGKSNTYEADENAQINATTHAAAKINKTFYGSLDAALEAAQAGDTITLVSDAETAKGNCGNTITRATKIDLNGKTLTLKNDDVVLDDMEFYNGTINVEAANASTAIFLMWNSGSKLTFDTVTVNAENLEGCYLVGDGYGDPADRELVIKNSTFNVNTSNGTKDLLAVIAFNTAGNDVKVINSTINHKNSTSWTFLIQGNTDVEISGESVINSDNVGAVGYFLNSSAKFTVKDTAVINATNIVGNEHNEDAYGILLGKDTVYTVDDTAKVNANVYRTPSAENLANTVKVSFTDVTENEGEAVYNIYVEADSEKTINRLTAVQMALNLTTEDDFEMTVTPADGVTRSFEDEMYLFNFDGETKPSATGTKIKIGQIKLVGYGTFTLSIDETKDNMVHATTLDGENLVTDFIVGGSKLGMGDFDISASLEAVEVKVPTRKLTVNVTFPNTVEENVVAYQDMSVKIGDETIALGDGDATEMENGTYVAMENGMYVITKDLEYNTSYTVEVSGGGYRTAYYTVTMNDNKTLNFWNNYKDTAVNVEEGKDATAKNATFLAGELVKDGKINIYDLSAVVSYFGTINNVDEKSEYAKYDLNRDGKIDSKDVAYVLVSWGK